MAQRQGFINFKGRLEIPSDCIEIGIKADPNKKGYKKIVWKSNSKKAFSKWFKENALNVKHITITAEQGIASQNFKFEYKKDTFTNPKMSLIGFDEVNSSAIHFTLTAANKEHLYLARSSRVSAKYINEIKQPRKLFCFSLKDLGDLIYKINKYDYDIPTLNVLINRKMFDSESEEIIRKKTEFLYPIIGKDIISHIYMSEDRGIYFEYDAGWGGHLKKLLEKWDIDYTADDGEHEKTKVIEDFIRKISAKMKSESRSPVDILKIQFKNYGD